MPVIDEIREQHEIVKKKGLKYRLQYFWDYYRTATLFTIIGLIFAGSIIHTFVTAKDTRFEVLMINSFSSPSQEAFGKLLEINEKKEEVTFDYNFYINPDPEAMDNATYANSQKLMAVIASKSADVMIAPETLFTRYVNGGVMGDLRNFFSESELEALGDKVLWLEIYDADNDETLPAAPLAIDVTDAPGLKDNACYPQDEKILMGPIINSKHPEDFKTFYNFLYSSESSSGE
ncbi:MAG: hypothetical protein K6E19_04785 [Lachnospiraceae bacterium]|nr:hypothetical protein [Lachnospiraceae bacterium]